MSSSVSKRASEVRALCVDFLVAMGIPHEVAPEGVSLRFEQDDLVHHFGCREASLVFSSGEVAEGKELVSPGTPFFDKVVSWLEGSAGEGSWLPLAACVGTRTQLPSGFGPLDKGRVPKISAEEIVDYEVVFRVSFVAEERHESLVVVRVSSEGEAEVLEVSSFEGAPDQVVSGEGRRPPTKKDVSAALERAREAAMGWVAEAGAPRERAVLEQLSLEVQRLTGYYGELIAENELNDEIREGLAADLDRRVSEEVERHRLRVELELLSYVVIAHQGQSFCYLLRAPTGEEVEATWRYDRVRDKVFSGRCVTCGSYVEQGGLCSAEEPHLVCEGCLERCDVCGVDACSEHGLVHCADGGEALCSGCAVRCGACQRPFRGARLRYEEGVARCTTCRAVEVS